jgi:hypothetical protein
MNVSDPDDAGNPFLSVSRTSPRPTFVLTFRTEPNTDGVRALRALLKTSLRRFGLKCISAVERSS